MSDLFLSDVNETDQIGHTKVVENTIGDDFLSPNLKVKPLLEQINWVLTHRKSEYVQSLLKLKHHKSVQIKRKTATAIAQLGTKEIITDLQSWQLQESDRDTWLLLDSAIDRLTRGIQTEPTSERVLSVSEALNQVKRLIGENEYTIEGELSEVRPVKQMYYFGLKDSQDTRLECSVFGGVILRGGFPLNDGLSVRVKGQFKLSKYSKIYFEIKSIQLTGEGELLRNLKLLEQKLEKEGFFDPTRKRPLSLLPQNILLIASPSSAAISDFTNVLQRRRGGINIYHQPIKTQGVGVEYELIETLNQVNTIIDEYAIDTVVITRGGGSKDDLQVFNTESVVRAIYGISKPTIVAIGHERDISLAELVADQRASTPSQAAELVSLSRAETLSQLHSISHSLVVYFQNRKNAYLLPTNQLWIKSLGIVNNRLKQAYNLCRQTDAVVFNLIHTTKQDTRARWQNISNNILQRLHHTRYALPNLLQHQNELSHTLRVIDQQTRWNYHKILTTTTTSIQQCHQQTQQIWQNIQLSDPKIILQRGYAMISQKGKIVETKDKLKPKEPFQITFQDGQIDIAT